MTITLKAIHIHPVKGCRRIEVDSAEVTATGLANDRSWQIVDGGGNALTQRQHREMATIHTELVDGGLRLTAGSAAVEVAHPSSNDRTVRALIGDEVEAADAGDEAAAFLHSVLGAEARLVGMSPESHREVPLFKGVEITFVDAAPVLVANLASLRFLQQRATEEFGIDRFRANLIVDGAEPWAEDTWRAGTLGEAGLMFALPWPRCAVPQIDQDTGDRTKEPAKILKEHRWCSDAPGMPDGIKNMLEGNALFGMSAGIGAPGTTVRVGDELLISETDAPLLAPPVS